jgi:hypothetical protein
VRADRTANRAEIVGKAFTSEGAKRKAAALIRRDRLPIDPFDVMNRATVTELQREKDGEEARELTDGYVESRLVYAYRDITRTEWRHRRRVAWSHDQDRDGDADAYETFDEFAKQRWEQSDDGGSAVAIVEDDETSARIYHSMQIALATADDQRTVVEIAAALSMLAISQNGGPPEIVPRRDQHLGENKVRDIAACWLADPQFRGDGGPDTPALRQRRSRFLADVTERLRQAASFIGPQQVSNP